MRGIPILYPGRYLSVRDTEDLARKAADRLLPNTCLVCDTPLSKLGPCQQCNAPFLVGIVRNEEDELYVQRHTEPITGVAYSKAAETRQKYLCLSCDGTIDIEGYCDVCDAKTRYCFSPGVSLDSGLLIRPDAIPMNADVEHGFAYPIPVYLIESPPIVVNVAPRVRAPVNVQPPAPVNVDPRVRDPVAVPPPEPETDRQRIRRLRFGEKLSLRQIEAKTGFSLGKIRHHIKKNKD